MEPTALLKLNLRKDFVAYLWQGGEQKGDNQNGNYCTKWNEKCSHRFIARFED